MLGPESALVLLAVAPTWIIIGSPGGRGAAQSNFTAEGSEDRTGDRLACSLTPRRDSGRIGSQVKLTFLLWLKSCGWRKVKAPEVFAREPGREEP